MEKPQAVTQNDTCAPQKVLKEKENTPDGGTSRQETVSANCLDRQQDPLEEDSSADAPNDIEKSDWAPGVMVILAQSPERKCKAEERTRNPNFFDSTFLLPCRIGTQNMNSSRKD